MSHEEIEDPYAGGVDSGGIPPRTKVQLPDHVTKLRKRSRRSAASANEPDANDESQRETR